jgi:predicted ATPase
MLSRSYSFGPESFFELHPGDRKLLGGGVAVALGSRAFDVLIALVQARGDLVTKEQLLQLAWPGLVVEEANVHVQVSLLRKLLGKDAVSTVSGLGYRFAWPVVEVKAAVARHNLPSEPTAFVGREATIAEMQAKMEGTRLLTLIGIGGTGKTRLARKLAERVLGRYTGGVWWIDLAPLDRPEQLAPAIAHGVGCRLEAGRDVAELLAEHLRAARALIVLDNCEHLVDGVAQLVERLMQNAPDAAFLTTSREALGLARELVVQVKPLSLPGPDAAAAEIRASDAVRLFVQAAVRSYEDFAIDERNAGVIASICRKVDGIPLALELAASQLKVLSPQQLHDVLEERFRLTLCSRRSLPRQQTLEAVIQWSFNHLSDEERILLTALSVCANGCDLEAVRALLGHETNRGSIVVGLSRLVELSLLTVRHELGVARYVLLETVRQFAIETLRRQGGERTLRDRHLAHYASVAHVAQLRLRSNRRTEALQLFDVERDNLSRALDWAIAGGNWQMGAELVAALEPYWEARGLHAVGLDQTAAVIAVLEEGAHPLATELLICGANLARKMGQFDRARGLAAEARRRAHRTASLEHQIDALIVIACCDLRDARPRQALTDLHAALAMLDRAGSHASRSSVFNALGQAHVKLGELQLASECFAKALAVDEQAGDLSGALMERLNLAFVAVRTGDPVEARRAVSEVAARLLDHPHQYMDCALLDLAGCLAALEGDWEQCLRAHLAATRHFADAQYLETAERRERRIGDVANARRRLTIELENAIDRSVQESTLAAEKAGVCDWLRAGRSAVPASGREQPGSAAARPAL